MGGKEAKTETKDMRVVGSCYGIVLQHLINNLLFPLHMHFIPISKQWEFLEFLLSPLA